MAAEIRRELAGAEVQLIPSSGGVFEVTVDGRLVFSKARSGRHAAPGEIVRLLQ